MSNLPDSLSALLSELYEVNDRICTGDIVSPKAAIASPRMANLLAHYDEALHDDGANAVSLQVYVAAGGWVGIAYSFVLDGHEINGSCTPRRV